MVEQNENPLSPTVVKVLDEFVTALKADGELNIDAVDRLDALLRKGKAPKPEEITAALFELIDDNAL